MKMFPSTNLDIHTFYIYCFIYICFLPIYLSLNQVKFLFPLIRECVLMAKIEYHAFSSEIHLME